MNRTHILLIFAFIASIPALVLLANVTWFAFTGVGFLIEGTTEINGARAFMAWVSSAFAVCLAGAASCA